jgi:hypothetical protein
MNAFRDDWGYLIVRATDSEFYVGGHGTYVNSLYFTNCLFFRSYVSAIEGWTDNQIHVRNCTFKGTRLVLKPYNLPNIMSVKDCAFEDATLVIANDGADPAYATYDYNAFLTAAPLFPIGGGNDEIVSAFGWESGPLGQFYLPSTSALIDAGSRSVAEAGLYHHTTQIAPDSKDTADVDIGLHYLALDTGGGPIDTDNDGLADYFEDSNGNGTYELGEPADWQDSDTDSDGLRDGTEVILGFDPTTVDTPTLSLGGLVVFTPLLD